MKQRYPVIMFVALAAALLLAGCPGTTTTTTTTGTPTRTVPPAHGTLTLAGVDPYTLDPAVAAEATSHTFINQLFSGLVRLDDDLNVVGDLASEWEISHATDHISLFLDHRFPETLEVQEDKGRGNGKHDERNYTSDHQVAYGKTENSLSLIRRCSHHQECDGNQRRS